MKKRIFALVLALCMALVLLPGAALAAGAIGGTCGENVSWSAANGVLTISGTGRIADYEYPQSTPWLNQMASLSPTGQRQSAVILEGVTGIGMGAFENCAGLGSVTLSSTVTSIKENAFIGCTGLTNIWVDGRNPAYTSVDGVLYTKDMKTLVAYPAGRQGTYAIPNGVTRVNDFAFSDCNGLTGVTIPASVTSVGSWAFLNCKRLTGVAIPASVTGLGEKVFNGCTSLTNIWVDGRNPAYTSVDGVLYTKDMKTLVAYPAGRQGAYVIPNGVTSIGTTFHDCNGLTSITIPGSMYSIESFTFWGCTNLSNVVINSGVTWIGDSVFCGCSNLNSVTIPASVRYIWVSSFTGCIGPQNVYYGGTAEQWQTIRTVNYQGLGGNFRDNLPRDCVHF